MARSSGSDSIEGADFGSDLANGPLPPQNRRRKQTLCPDLSSKSPCSDEFPNEQTSRRLPGGLRQRAP